MSDMHGSHHWSERSNNQREERWIFYFLIFGIWNFGFITVRNLIYVNLFLIS